MIIDAISNGIVIDHITAGKAMYLYKVLELDKLDCSVALLKNVVSNKLGPRVSQIAVRIGEKTIMASPVLAEQSPMARPFFRWNQRLIRIVAGIMEPKP